LLRTAKACGSGTRGWCQAGGDLPGPTGLRGIVNSSAMEARGIRLQGERVISRQTIAQGRPDAPADTCMLVCVFVCLLHTRSRVPASTRYSLRPLIFRGLKNSSTTRARIRAARMRNHVHPRHCERSEAIHCHRLCGRMDCFASLAMTRDSVSNDDGCRRVGKGAKRRAHHLSPILAARWWARCALPTLQNFPLTTPAHSKTQTSSPAACSHPKSASA
jgi:hypothetical protein